MGTNTATTAALEDASKRHAERQAYAFKAAKRLYESGLALKKGCRYGWVIGTPE